MSNFIESIKARVAREKKIGAEIAAGLAYLRDHHERMPTGERLSALSWLMHHAKAGHIGQDEIDRFLKADNDRQTPVPYPDEGTGDETTDGDDSPIDDRKPKKGKKKAQRASRYLRRRR